MAPTQILTAAAAGAIGAKAVPLVRGFVPLEGGMQTAAIVAGGVAIAVAGCYVHNQNKGAGLAGAAIAGAGLGLALAAAVEHFGF